MHISLCVDGAIRQRAFTGLLTDNGVEMSRQQAEAELKRLQSQGVKLIPSGECEGFSDQTGCPGHRNPRIDWVIAGFESGPKARPGHPDWARSLRDQCQAAGVPFFFKQWGSWVPGTREHGFEGHVLPKNGRLKNGTQIRCVAIDGQVALAGLGLKEPAYAMCRVDKKAAGRLLDGREWNEMPSGEVVHG